jgi:uncharacterized SAM-binding protein YcdF (DUF218 family)
VSLARILWRVVLGTALLGAVFLAVTYLQVRRAASADDAGPADAIVVLGAAQYDGAPSPVLQGRLMHALALWEQGLAPLIVTTGSNQPGDRFTQGFAGYTWLRDQGVPDSDIVVITDGRTTYEELSATAQALRARAGGADVVLVSEGYHHLRAVETAAEVGLRATFSPTALPSSEGRLVREAAAVAAGRLIGYRRISQIG